MADPGGEEEAAAAGVEGGSTAKQRLKPAPPPPPPPPPSAASPSFLAAASSSAPQPAILLLDGVSNFTAFFEDGRDLLDGSGDGPPGRAVFTALFVRDGLPGGAGGGGGADLRGEVVFSSPSAPSSSAPSSSSTPARLALTSVRLAQYDAAARQLVLTAVAGGGAGFPAASRTVTLRGVALTFEAAPRGGAAASAAARPEGPAAARAAAAALKAAKAAGWGGAASGGGGGGSGGRAGGSAVGIPHSMGGPRPAPRPVEPAAAAAIVSTSSAGMQR